MFLNMSKLDKAMKAAYKMGVLRIGCVHEGTYISNGHFAAWMNNDYIENEMKGLIIKYAGQMPEEEGKGLLLGPCGSAKIEQPVNQTFDLPKYYISHEKEEVENTDLSYKNMVILQEEYTNKIHFVKKELFNMIDVRMINHECGETPMAPPVHLTGTCSVVFRNSAGFFLVLESVIDSEAVGMAELVKCLKSIDLNERA